MTHFLLILHRSGFYFVRNWQTIFDISGVTTTIKEGTYSVVCLKASTASTGCIFIDVLTVSFYPVIDSVVLGEEELRLLWDNLR